MSGLLLEADEPLAHGVEDAQGEGAPGFRRDVVPEQVQAGLFIPLRPIVEKWWRRVPR